MTRAEAKALRRVRMEAGHRTATAEIYPKDTKKLAGIRSLMEVDFVTIKTLRFKQLSTPGDFLQLNLKEFHEENRVEQIRAVAADKGHWSLLVITLSHEPLGQGCWMGVWRRISFKDSQIPLDAGVPSCPETQRARKLPTVSLPTVSLPTVSLTVQFIYTP